MEEENETKRQNKRLTGTVTVYTHEESKTRHTSEVIRKSAFCAPSVAYFFFIFKSFVGVYLKCCMIDFKSIFFLEHIFSFQYKQLIIKWLSSTVLLKAEKLEFSLPGMQIS